MATLSEVYEVIQQAIDAKDFRTAEALCIMLLERNENDGTALGFLGSVFVRKGKHAMGIILLKRAVELLPQLYPLWNNLGIAYRMVGRLEDARTIFETTLQLAPDHVQALANMASTFINAGAPEKAEEWARKALAIDPQQPEAGNQLALSLLEQERWAEGWDAYDARFRLEGWHRRSFGGAKPWDGKAIGRLAIAGEQGIGDEMMFANCVADVIRIVGKENVFLESTPELAPITRHSLGIPVFPSEQAMMDRIGRVDYRTELGTLPKFFRRRPEDWPQHTGYLSMSYSVVRNARTQLERLGPGPIVGLAWRGGTKKTHGYLRNAGLEYWAALMESIRAAGGTPVSVQYGNQSLSDVEREAAALNLPHDQQTSLNFYALTARTKACDLVITVCQTAFHVRGSFGQPVICLVPYWPAWRYQRTGSTSLWYPSATLIRQSAPGSWDSAFAECTAMLSEKLRAA